MKKYPLLILIPFLFISCSKEPDDNYAEPEYKILSYTEDATIFCTFSYPSVDSDGNPIQLSSALFAYNPTKADSSAEIRTVIAASHITVTSGVECPSKIKSAFTLNDVTVLQTLPANAQIPELRQSVIIMPDLEGYGITEHLPHPYLSRELSARQTADAIRYGILVYKSLEKALPFADDWKSICLGYSQGGSVALATHRYIEENALDDEFHFAGSFCAGGAYNLIEILRYYISDDGWSSGVETRHTKGTLSLPVVMPLIVKGMLDSNPYMKEHDITDYFSKQFLDTGILDWLNQKTKSTNDIARAWYTMREDGLTAKDGTYYSPLQIQELFPTGNTYTRLLMKSYEVSADLSRMLTPSLFDYLNNPSTYDGQYPFTGDRFEDLLAALDANSNITGWKPGHKIILLHSRYDTVVPYTNMLSFAQSHPDADIKVVDLGTKDHQDTGSDLFMALINKTFSKDIAWLFAEK